MGQGVDALGGQSCYSASSSRKWIYFFEASHNSITNVLFLKVDEVVSYLR